jgi:hypothetical protein
MSVLANNSASRDLPKAFGEFFLNHDKPFGSEARLNNI